MSDKLCLKAVFAVCLQLAVKKVVKDKEEKEAVKRNTGALISTSVKMSAPQIKSSALKYTSGGMRSGTQLKFL